MNFKICYFFLFLGSFNAFSNSAEKYGDFGCLDQSLSEDTFINSFAHEYDQSIKKAFYDYTRNDFIFINGYLDSGYNSFPALLFYNEGEEVTAAIDAFSFIRHFDTLFIQPWPQESNIVEKIRLIESGIQESPTTPCDMYVYSGQVSPLKFKKNQFFKFESLLSTSLKWHIAYSFARMNNITYPISHMFDFKDFTIDSFRELNNNLNELNRYMFKIKIPKNTNYGALLGRPNNLAYYQSEYEYLMRSNLCLKVNKKKRLKHGVVTLLELDIYPPAQCQ